MTDTRVYHFDCAIVGAGLSGLVCAQHLQGLGLRVVVLDKSRGVGGRVATRRLHNTYVDHGLPFLTVQGEHTQRLIDELCEQNILQPWSGKVEQLSCPDVFTPLSGSRYIASRGMTAIAKFLARDLEIWRNCRVTQLTLRDERYWLLKIDSSAEIPLPITAKAIVLAIPAPQSVMLLEASSIPSFSSNFLHQLRGIEFNPTLSVMAGYSPQYHSQLLQLSWQGIKIIGHHDLAWVGLDSSKRDQPEQSVFVAHSTPQFAQGYLDADYLEVAGQQLLQCAQQVLLIGLDQPEWVQVHRWRYAFPRLSLSLPCLSTTQPLPLVCCGDWCGKKLAESALMSGIAAAREISGIFL